MKNLTEAERVASVDANKDSRVAIAIGGVSAMCPVNEAVDDDRIAIGAIWQLALPAIRVPETIAGQIPLIHQSGDRGWRNN